MKSLRVAFMGTPDFAVLPLKKIVDSEHKLVAVVTVPDKQAGRGRKTQVSAVKNFAVEQNLKILQPEKLRAPEFINELEGLEIDVIVVVAFRMLPEMVWKIPAMGTFNLHASLLPQYRGAAPINWAIINGEDKSGVTTFFINEHIDTGAILLQRSVSIEKEDNAGALHDKLMVVGADLVVETLDGLANKSLQATPQEAVAEIKQAPKIFKDDCRINWEASGIEIERLVKGLSPYPGAFAEIVDGGLTGVLKIQSAKFENNMTKHETGVLFIENKSIYVALADGRLEILKLQPQGKRAMASSDFINGLQNRSDLFRLK